MAENKNKKNELQAEDSVQQLSDLERLMAHAQENPKLYLYGVLVVVLLIVFSLVYRYQARVNDRDIQSRFASVVLSEKEPVEKVKELGALLDGGAGRWTPEVLYLLGETAIASKEYDKANSVFDRLQKEYPASERVADAVAAQGFLLENGGKYEEALKTYQQVVEKWPNSFAAQIRHNDIGRVLESLKRLPDAIAAYNKQKELMPDPQTASNYKASAELARLEKAHPDLFPKKEAPVAAEGEAAKATPAPAVAPVVEGTSPADETPSSTTDDVAAAEGAAAPAAQQ